MVACSQDGQDGKKKREGVDQKDDLPPQPLTEFSDVYTCLRPENIYSSNVDDTFKIFRAIPSDTGKSHPLVIILDANAFFESVVTELKFNSYIGLVPNSIIVGIGYRDLMTMDSLRSRDYTYPVAIPEYEMALSGGADKMKSFIDKELLPKLSSEFNIDPGKIVLCGHSLGGYFTLYYGLRSIADNSFPIRNIVSASPSLHYNHRYLFDMEKNLKKPSTEVPLKIYVSMGSADMEDAESKGILHAFGSQVTKSKYQGLNLTEAEYSNFGHLDAAVPGIIKGLEFIFNE